MMTRDITKRRFGRFTSYRPLMSERVAIILSFPEDAKRLADAVRSLRRGGSGRFTLTDECRTRLLSGPSGSGEEKPVK